MSYAGSLSLPTGEPDAKNATALKMHTEVKQALDTQRGTDDPGGRCFVVKMVLLLLAVPIWATTPCNPLLVLVEGGSASSDGTSMEALARSAFRIYPREERTTVVSIDNGYFFSAKWWSLWTIPAMSSADERRNVGVVVAMIEDAGHWPIVLVGHSLGGSTAYEIAASAPSTLLVTLDAVSSPDDGPSLGRTRWINVYAHNHWWGLGNSLGEDWEYEPNADQNIRMKNTSHSAANSMFKAVEYEIIEALRSCNSRPDELPRRLDLNSTTGFCQNDQVNCAYAVDTLRP